MSHRTTRLGLMALLIAGFSIVAPGTTPAMAAKRPTPGFPCTAEDASKRIQTPEMKLRGVSLICAADESEHAHEDLKGGKPHTSQRPRFIWAWYAEPRATPANNDFLTIPNIAARVPSDIIGALNAPYTLPEVAPCKISSYDPPTTTTVASYGQPGLFGRNVPGYSPTFGKVTIGVIISVPTDYEIRDSGLTAYRPAAGDVPERTVTYASLQARVSNLQSYLQAYFMEQSYGQLNFEFVYFPKILRGNRSSAAMDDDEWQPPAVQAYNAASQVDPAFWQSTFVDVDTIWSVIVDKPGAYAVRAFRQTEGRRQDITQLVTPVGTFATTLQSAVPATGDRDKPLVAHELYHTLRLPDSYQRAQNAITTRMVGRIGRGGSGYTTSGMLGWDRYISRWLKDENVTCITPLWLESRRRTGAATPSVTVRAIQEPVVAKGEKKLVVIPFTATRKIVVESWAPIGSDRANVLPGSRDTAQTGALVYIVNTATANGLDVRSTAADWPLIDSPVTLYREDLWTIDPARFPVGLTGCEAGAPTESEADSNCNDLMQDLIRRQAFLRTPGQIMEIPLPFSNRRELCQPNQLRPDIPLEGSNAVVRLQLQSTETNAHTVQVGLLCKR